MKVRVHAALRGTAPVPEEGCAALCVLASGSSGNCSVLLYNDRGRRRACMIDAGISPRRTAGLLSELGVGIHEVADVLLTHLDSDHAHSGWWTRPPRDFRATLRLHAAQLGRAERQGMLCRPTEVFGRGAASDGFELAPGTRVRDVTLAHDDLGVSAFRFDCGSAALGFATDLGCVTQELIDALAGVDVLAIESNYCPRLQAESDRPEFLKRRIMGGAGHLSNEQAADATRSIRPTSHGVLLHLSRQCNRPDIAAAHHAGADYDLTIATQDAPTRWVRIEPRSGGARRAPAPRERAPLGLFG